MSGSFRVGFDARPVRSAYSGIGQYVRQLFPAMFQINPTIEWVAYTSTKQPENLSGLEAMASLHIQASQRQWVSGRMGNFHEPLDLFHGTNFKAPNYGQKKTVLTIHDLWLDRNPEYSKKFFGQRLSSWKTRRGAVRAEKIIAVSKFSRKEIHEVFDIPLDKIAVIYHGCTHDMFQDCDENTGRELRDRLGLSDRPFIVFVGGAEPRKNHRLLFEAFAKSRRLVKEFSLVAIGDETVRSSSLRQTAQALGLLDIAKFPGILSTEDLRKLYSHAHVLVFPSLYEGFGIPILEAMACGTPIITGQTAAMPEVAGDAALYVNVHDVEQLREVLEKLVHDRELQEELRQKGFERVKHFTWERAARETLAVYQEMCSRS